MNFFSLGRASANLLLRSNSTSNAVAITAAAAAAPAVVQEGMAIVAGARFGTVIRLQSALPSLCLVCRASGPSGVSISALASSTQGFPTPSRPSSFSSAQIVGAGTVTVTRRRNNPRPCALKGDGWVRGWEKKVNGRLFSQAASAAVQVPSTENVKMRRRVLVESALAVEVGGLTINRDDVVKEDDPTNNVPDSVFSKLGMQLHNREDHPLGILKNEIYSFFDERFQGVFKKYDNLSPIVSVKANFDDVLVPEDHVSRRYNDTYYINAETVLRCHTSAHQAEKLREGQTHFLVAGDVYRRDAIDATHYPVFHQMEGFLVFDQSEWEKAGLDGTTFASTHLKKTLEGLVERVFGKVEMKWVDTYFPFTDPSYELEIFYKEAWLEVLGCGVVEQRILDENGRKGTKAWAFGLGLERLAMVLFEIPDIRLFWSDDPRFTTQFQAGKLGTKFKSFSKFPPCYKDISFWISDKFSENNLCELIRGVAGDLVEEVTLIDEFTNPKKGKTSHCYRITYRSMERSLTDDEINDYQSKVRKEVESTLEVSLR